MAEEPRRILVIDDEPAIRASLATALERNGYISKAAASGEEGIALFDADPFDIVITDIRMPGLSGIDVMRHVKSRVADTIVLLITAHASLETAIEGIREGASDYLTKPVRFENLALKIRNLLKIRELEWENRILRIERRQVSYLDELTGESTAIRDLKQSILRICAAPGNVLIEGESGTGKELAARAIHAGASERRGAFVAVNCGSVPETLLESEFFGYRRGAFTGAQADKDGLFQEARNGTLFLDEVSELPLSLQPKLLRAIENKEVRPLGSSEAVPIDARIVAASNRSLEELVSKSRFREDLFYRLDVFRLKVPALRDRVGDIPLLAAHFLEKFRSEIPSPATEISPNGYSVLEQYAWKGNVRELQNVLQRALITATHPVIDAALLQKLLGLRRHGDRQLKQALRDFERYHIRRVLEDCDGVKQQAAERLGISLASLYAKLKD